MTDVPNEAVADLVDDTSVTVRFGEHETVGIFRPGHAEPDSTLVAVLGDSGFLEIGIVGTSLSEMLGISTGQRVVINW